MVVPLHAYINPGLVAIIMLLFLAGCATTPAPTPESEQLPETAPAGGMPQKKVSPEVQQAFDKAVATLRSGNYKQAIREFSSVSRRAPKLAAPYINQAIAYRHTDDLLLAEKATQEALKRDSKSPEALNMLGLIKRANGDFKAAKNSYQQAISIRPDYAEAHLNLAMLCDIYLVDWSCAKTHYDRFQAIQGQPDKQVKGWIADLDRRMKKAGKR